MVTIDTLFAGTHSTSAAEARILDALQSCVERWGFEKVTIDDVAQEAKVSRATIYRLFPGGRDVMFEALRVRNLTVFFEGMRSSLLGADSLLDLTVRISVYATNELRNDAHLVSMLAAEDASVLREFSVNGLPRIINVASAYLLPFVTEFLPPAASQRFVDLAARLLISHFLAPSPLHDLGEPESAREFFAPLVQLIHIND